MLVDPKRKFVFKRDVLTPYGRVSIPAFWIFFLLNILSWVLLSEVTAHFVPLFARDYILSNGYKFNTVIDYVSVFLISIFPSLILVFSIFLITNRARDAGLSSRVFFIISSMIVVMMILPYISLHVYKGSILGHESMIDFINNSIILVYYYLSIIVLLLLVAIIAFFPTKNIENV